LRRRCVARHAQGVAERLLGGGALRAPEVIEEMHLVVLGGAQQVVAIRIVATLSWIR